MQMEINKTPAISSRYAAKVLEPLISKKWKEVNPLLPLISTDSIVLKIDRLYKTCKTIEDKHCSIYKTKILISKWRSFLIFLFASANLVRVLVALKIANQLILNAFVQGNLRSQKMISP